MKMSSFLVLSFLCLSPILLLSQKVNLKDYKTKNPIKFNKKKGDGVEKTFKRIEKIIKKANNYDVIKFDKKDVIVFPRTLIINKKLMIIGLNGKAKKPKDQNNPTKEEKFVLIHIQSKKVVIDDFTLRSFYNPKIEKELDVQNESVADYKNPYEKGRESLIEVNEGDFIIKNGYVYNSLMHGILITPDSENKINNNHLERGLIKNIEGTNNQRDVVSIAGAGKYGHVMDIKVKKIKCWHSADRGAVEVSDGTKRTTVDDVQAYFSQYAVDIQDHYDSTENKEDKETKKMGTNRGVTLKNLRATNCTYGIKTTNDALDTINEKGGHGDLDVDDAVFTKCGFPIEVSNITNLKLKNICIIDDHKDPEAPYVIYPKQTRIHLENCNGNNVFENISIWDPFNLYNKNALCIDNNCVEIGQKIGNTKIKSENCDSKK